jgi:hypothetical protein
MFHYLILYNLKKDLHIASDLQSYKNVFYQPIRHINIMVLILI